jgi:hypothetical protein
MTAHNLTRRPRRLVASTVVGVALLATAVQAVPVSAANGGVLKPGYYCNGWIHRTASPMHIHIHDKTGGRPPTKADCANAHAFFNKVMKANAKYADFNVALKNDFRRGNDDPHAQVQHWVYWHKVPEVLDPNRPEGLMYKKDPNTGKMRWYGVFFVEKGSPNLPQPGGSLTAWHSHEGMDMPWMFHVWTFAGATDPFAAGLPAATR